MSDRTLAALDADSLGRHLRGLAFARRPFAPLVAELRALPGDEAEALMGRVIDAVCRINGFAGLPAPRVRPAPALAPAARRGAKVTDPRLAEAFPLTLARAEPGRTERELALLLTPYRKRPGINSIQPAYRDLRRRERMATEHYRELLAEKGLEHPADDLLEAVAREYATEPLVPESVSLMVNSVRVEMAGGLPPISGPSWVERYRTWVVQSLDQKVANAKVAYEVADKDSARATERARADREEGRQPYDTTWYDRNLRETEAAFEAALAARTERLAVLEAEAREAEAKILAAAQVWRAAALARFEASGPVRPDDEEAPGLELVGQTVEEIEGRAAA